MSYLKKISIGVGILLTLVAITIPTAKLFGSDSAAVAYLKSKSLSPWSVMALSAAGESTSLEGLRTVSGAKAIDLEAPILALTAAGEDPRSFGGENLVTKLKGFYDGTQLGETDIINDDIFGLLALIGSGESQSDVVVSDIKNFIISKQSADGGFSFAVGGTSDTNTTAAAIMALRSAGIASTDPVLQNAASYLKNAQNSDGGFPYDPNSPWGTESDASSDAWVIMATVSMNEDAAAWKKDGKTPAEHLEGLQQENGYFLYQDGSAEDSFTPITTSYALIALSGKTLPLKIIEPDAPSTAPVSVRIEGKDKNLCDTEAEGATALDALQSAADSCGIAVRSVHSSLGEYIDDIAGEKAAGAEGWLYAVNGVKPSVGASDYALSANDEMLWYFGEFTWMPVRLSLSTDTVESGASASGTVEYFDGVAWKPLSAAVIKGTAAAPATNESGVFNLSVSDGNYALFAEKEGFVRSNVETVTVGTPIHADIPLSITIPEQTSGTNGAGGGNNSSPDTISILVDGANAAEETAVGFGAVARGATAEKTLTLQNRGAGAVVFSASVSGDSLFRRFLQLNRNGWRSYRVLISASAATTTALSIAVPSDWDERGTKTGSLTFWVTPAAQ